MEMRLPSASTGSRCLSLCRLPTDPSDERMPRARLLVISVPTQSSPSPPYCQKIDPPAIPNLHPRFPIYIDSPHLKRLYLPASLCAHLGGWTYECLSRELNYAATHAASVGVILITTTPTPHPPPNILPHPFICIPLPACLRTPCRTHRRTSAPPPSSHRSRHRTFPPPPPHPAPPLPAAPHASAPPGSLAP